MAQAYLVADAVAPSDPVAGDIAAAHLGSSRTGYLATRVLVKAAFPVSQAELAGRLELIQGAISKREHSDDVCVSTVRQYLEALGARLELVAVFDDEGRRVPVHLGNDTAA